MQDVTAPLQLLLLGAFAVHDPEGRSIAISARKNRAMLAILALSPGLSASRERLAGLLWGDRPEEQARASLRQALAVLRKDLRDGDESLLLASEDTVRLAAGRVKIDASDFLALSKSGETADLLAAAELYRGEFLADFPFREEAVNNWIAEERRQLSGRIIRVLEHLAAHGPAADRIDYGKRLLAQDPLREASHRALMQAYADAGDRAQALRQFEDCRSLLRRELAVEPSPQTVALRQLIAAPVPAPPARSVGLASDAPVPTSRFSGRSRAAIVVLPFDTTAEDAPHQGGWAHGLLQDITYKLAKLRSFSIISADTALAVTGPHSPREIGGLLKADYVCRGRARAQGGTFRIEVELAACADERIIWTQTFEREVRNVMELIELVSEQIIRSLVVNLEREERNRAVAKAPETLDAWDSYHRGLWHMLRFREADNETAAQFFGLACEKDPTYARSYAGLSFTHWLKAYVLHPSERRMEARLSLNAALDGLSADSDDPAVNCALGRALWISGSTGEALGALGRSTELSPHYAFAHYVTGFVECQSGDPVKALAALEQAEVLSPLDPFRCAYMASRGIALVRLGQFAEASEWALRGTLQPNAHFHIHGVAAMCLAAAGRVDEARSAAVAVKSEYPGYGSLDHLSGMNLSADDHRLFRSLARTAGFD